MLQENLDRHIWSINTNFDGVVERLSEINAEFKVFNTISTYFIKDDSIVIVEAMSEVTKDDQHKSIAPGVYSEPETTLYEFNEFIKVRGVWTPVKFQEPITREDFYAHITSDPTSVVNCIHISAESHDRPYRFDFNLEKGLNTLTLLCDGDTCARATKTFKSFIGERVSEEDYRNTVFNFDKLP